MSANATTVESKPTAWNDLAISAVMAGTAGFVDTCGFVALFGLFTAHVTGNFVLIGAELVNHTNEVLLKLLALPAFVLAVVLAVKADEALARLGRARVAPLLYAEAALLLLSFAAAVHPPAHAADPSAIAAGLLAAAAMGLQNALMRLQLASLPNTTVMTLTVTQGTIDLVTLLGRADSAKRGEARKRFARLWPQVVSFTFGAAAGAGGYALAGLAALLVPALACIYVGLRWTEPAASSS